MVVAAGVLVSGVLPASGQSRSASVSAAGRSTFDFENAFAGIYSFRLYLHEPASGDRPAFTQYRDVDYSWGQVTYFRCEKGKTQCAAETRLAAHGTAESGSTGASSSTCTVTGVPSKSFSYQVPESAAGLPAVVWFLDGSGQRGSYTAGDPIQLGLQNEGLLRQTGSDPSCQGQFGLPADASTVGSTEEELYCPVLEGAFATKDYPEAFFGEENVDREQLPVAYHLGGTDSCTGAAQDTAQGPYGTSAMSVSINDDDWFGELGKLCPRAKPRSICDKVGNLLVADGFAIMNATTAELTSKGVSSQVLIPDPEAGDLKGEVYGQVLPGRAPDKPRAGDATANGTLIATTSAHLNGTSPLALVTVKPTSQAAQVLTSSHGPIKLTATVSFHPQGSTTTITNTVTTTLPATSF
jgi:hypothetical protein